MNKKDLDALSGLYKSVYSPADSGEYLSEDYLLEAPQNDIGYRVGRGLMGALRDLPSGLAAQVQGRDNAALQRQRQRGQNLKNLLKTGKVDTPTAKPAAKPAAKPVKPAAKPTLTDAEFDKKYGTNDPNNNLARPENNKPRVIPSASRPAATPGSGAKVAPTAPKPVVKQTGDKAKDMATWAKANPTLANKPKTPNPLMKDMPGQNKAELDQLRGNAAINSISQSPSAKNILSGTAKSSTANQIGKASLDRSAAATEAKPASNVFSRSKETVKKMTSTPNPANQNISSGYEWPSAKTIRDIAGAYASIYEGKKKDQDQDGDNDFADVRIARMIASGMSKAEAIAAVKNKEYNEEFESWVDSLVEEGYDLSDYTMDEMFDIYLDETTLSAKAARAGKDIGAKGKNFAKIAASAGERYGSAEAGKRVAGAILKKMRANEEFELDEATRMRKELGKEGETATRKELAARSKAHKRSGSVDKTIAAAERAADWSGDEKKAKALRGLAASRRGSVRDKPRAGMRGYAAKVEGGDKDLQSARQGAMSAGTLTPREKKQLGEVYEIVASYLLENNFATTINDANAIIENMSEVWLNQILENAE